MKLLKASPRDIMEKRSDLRDWIERQFGTQTHTVAELVDRLHQRAGRSADVYGA